MKQERIRRIVAMILALCLCLALAGCGKDKKEPDTPKETTPQATQAPAAETAAPTTPAPEAPVEEAAPATPEPEKPTVEILYENKPVTSLSFMTSTVFPLKASVSDGSTGGTWTSSDAGVASVDENGVVTCWKVGKPRITYTVGEVSASVELEVSEATVKICFGGVEKNDISLSGTWGYEIQLESLVSPAGAAVTWSSEDTSVATISENGLVKALRGGNTNIVCKCGTAKAVCVIRVLGMPPEQQMEIANATPDPNDTTPRVIITYAGAANSDFTTPVGTSVDMNYILRNIPEDSAVTWTIKDTVIATVNADGVVTGVSVGTTTLTAKCGEYSCDCIVRIAKNN